MSDHCLLNEAVLEHPLPFPALAKANASLISRGRPYFRRRESFLVEVGAKRN
jgi:hypothetical protein